MDALVVEKGYEKALGAALGDDLDAPVDHASAPMRWAGAPLDPGDPHLPEGATTLARFVQAPAELARRLTQIGVVERADGPQLATQLKPGQRLVSREGDFWRWDGFAVAAHAPTGAARRLAERGRLEAIEGELAAAREDVHSKLRTLETAEAARAAAAAAEIRAARNGARPSTQPTRRARTTPPPSASSAGTWRAFRRSWMPGSASSPAATKPWRHVSRRLPRSGSCRPPPNSKPSSSRSTMSLPMTAARSPRSASRRRRSPATLNSRAAACRRSRSNATPGANARIKPPRRSKRSCSAPKKRGSSTPSCKNTPQRFAEQRQALIGEVEAAAAQRRAAADTLAQAENELAEADKAARAALEAVGEARADLARAEERYGAATRRVADIEHEIRDQLDVEPAATAELAEFKTDGESPQIADVEARLDRIKRERERLGAVNLRAEEELREVEAQHDKLASERDDLIEAIKRLRQGIHSLNHEARERLLASFTIVHDNFKKLFTELFGGGTAELQLIEHDDPLEAGLEIVARPPGKKTVTLSLLSGGEQALTALALIFAVFLTNPAPICVLDEVDAPLDDNNVERFCDLLDEMARSTETRFIIITHNPITMARMNRLYGVTMAERGVSQLVSVDLEGAVKLREAS